MKPSFFLFLASVIALILAGSIWLLPVALFFAALAIRDVRHGLTMPPWEGELGIDNDKEADMLAARFVRFRKALHD